MTERRAPSSAEAPPEPSEPFEPPPPQPGGTQWIEREASQPQTSSGEKPERR